MNLPAPERLRVAVVARAVSPLHGLGGLERSVRDLVRHLAQRGVGVTLITPPPAQVQRRGIEDPFASPAIQLRHVSYLTFPFANRRGTTILDRSTSYLLYGERAGRLAASLVRAGEIDIVHGFGASVLGYARTRHRPAPLVLNPQGLEEFGATLARQSFAKRVGYTPLRWAVRRVAQAADCIISTDASLDATVTRHLKPRPGVLRTIPNGIDLTEVSSLAGPPEGSILRQRHGLSPAEFVLLSVGRLERNKGFDDLAAALGRVAHEGGLRDRPWRWVIVGTGPFKAEIEQAIRRAGIGERVIFAGRASDADLHAWYEAASLFVHPTRYEGSSLVTLEAMAHRRAVVATRAGGLPDKVRTGTNGWLVEPGDVPALAQAINEAAAAGDAVTAMGAASRTIVEETFAWPRIVERQLEVYAELMERRR